MVPHFIRTGNDPSLALGPTTGYDPLILFVDRPQTRSRLLRATVKGTVGLRLTSPFQIVSDGTVSR
ncbi:MAG: hypothetical protein BWY17_00488 [Deltaproteobacteria bacterium ADurb.Bin207]|jgi:hypothetical protein|nr:MAG: hypothetical protein BWY17_00488 [Deltaproteobacteria bacterium ADurb.Bin207]